MSFYRVAGLPGMALICDTVQEKGESICSALAVLLWLSTLGFSLHAVSENTCTISTLQYQL